MNELINEEGAQRMDSDGLHLLLVSQTPDEEKGDRDPCTL